MQLELASKALSQHAACARHGGSYDHASLFGMVGLWLEYQQVPLPAQPEPPIVTSPHCNVCYSPDARV